MTAPDVPPEVIEKAARAVAATEKPCRKALDANPTEGCWMDNGHCYCVQAARAVLAAVADDIRAEGATCSCGGSGLYPNVVPGVGTEWVSCPDCNRAEIEARGYQRGMAEGARQVLAVVEEAHASWPVLVQQPPPEFEGGLVGDPDSVTLRVSQRLAWLTEQEYRARFGDEPPTGPVLAAVREAVTRIEKGTAK